MAPAPPSTRSGDAPGKPPKPWRPQFPWAPFADAADGRGPASGLQRPRGRTAPAGPRVSVAGRTVAGRTVGPSDVAHGPGCTRTGSPGRMLLARAATSRGTGFSCRPRASRREARGTALTGFVLGVGLTAAPSPAPPPPGSHSSRRQGKTEARGSCWWQGWLSRGPLVSPKPSSSPPASSYKRVYEALEARPLPGIPRSTRGPQNLVTDGSGGPSVPDVECRTLSGQPRSGWAGHGPSPPCGWDTGALCPPCSTPTLATLGLRTGHPGAVASWTGGPRVRRSGAEGRRRP